jgi:hypothetical protein
MFKYTASILTGLTLLAANASAADFEVASYPGGNCVAADQSPAPATVYWDGEIANPSTTSPSSVYCPIPTIVTSGVPQVKEIQLRMTDRNSAVGKDTVCKGNTQIMDANGVVIFWLSPDIKGNMTYAPGLMTSARVPWGPLVIGYNSGFQCSVPPKTNLGTSSIFSYDVIR